MDAGKGLAWKGGAPDEMINVEGEGPGAASCARSISTDGLERGGDK